MTRILESNPGEALGSINTVRESDPVRLSHRLRQDLLAHLEPGDLVCIPTGRSPELLYELIEEDQASISLWRQLRFLQLDEYISPPGGTESFRSTLRRQVFEPLQIPDDQVFSIDPAADPESEANRLDALFSQLGPPRAVILGLGSNGHIAFNEPRDTPRSGYQVVELSQMTILDNFPQPVPEQVKAITIGLDQLRSAERVYLLVPQPEKSEILDRCLKAPYSSQLPGSILHDHPDLHVYRS